MAFSNLASRGAGNSKTSSTTVAVTPSPTLNAGEVILVAVATDNAGTSDAATNEVTSITDSVGGNTWIKLYEYSRGSPGANAGSTVALFMSKLTNSIPDTGTITGNLSSNRTAKVIAVLKCDVTSGNTIVAVAQMGHAAAGSASVSLSGLASKQYLWVLAFSSEQNTAQSLSVGLTQVGSFTTGGGSAANMAGVIGAEVITATGRGPYNLASAGPNDSAGVMVALEDIAGAKSPPPYAGTHRPRFMTPRRRLI